MSRKRDMHVRYFDGAFCIFDGDRWVEECATEGAAHARLAAFRKSGARHVISASALRGDRITHGTRDGRHTLCGRTCEGWQEEYPGALDDPPDCLSCARRLRREASA